MGLKSESYIIGWLSTNLSKGLLVCGVYLSIAGGVGGF